METVDQNYDNFMEHASNRQLNPPSSPDISDIVGASQLNPRLGHEYQVEVPSMIKESERIQLQMNPADSEHVHDEVEDSGHEGWRYLGDNDGTINVTVPPAAADVKKNGISEDGKELRPTNFQSVMTDGQLNKGKNYLMVPGTLSNSWSEADVKGFLLGLFIFGKNFVQIRRFLENKGMGEILSFYYGKFYKSDEHRRWSECKKLKGRKCITGHKLFTGWKQHELLSRLIPRVSKEFKDTLLQVSKSYSEGRTSLEEYIFSLKSTVGLGVLVEAVGIGKGKEDLTSLAVERGKKNRVFPIPTSKAWSSLGPSDIMKLLTGGIRLSKAKSNDLFWEAVWPRLLARGWHSEQLKNQGCFSSKAFLVFLIPGVKKFSRRKLVKGDHYFDSVSDVLSKVVADPNLLELEVEEAKAGSCNDEEAEKGSKENGQSDHHRLSYLKPQASTNNTDHMKYTIIDTSLKHGRKSDIRELKSLPGNLVGKIEVDAAGRTYKGDKHNSKSNHSKGKIDSINQKLTESTELEEASKMIGIARESDMRSSVDKSPSETEAAMLIHGKRNIRNAECQKDTHNRDAISLKEVNCNQDDNANKMAKNHENQKTCVSKGDQLKGTTKHQCSQRARSGHSNLAVPPIKRRRLTACVKAETSRIQVNSPGGSGSKKPGLSQSSCFPDTNNNAGGPVSHQQDASSVSCSAEGSVEENDEGSFLKTAQIPLKPEDSEMMAMVKGDEEGLKPNDMIPRRKSIRNRPLTARALESLANEFLHVQRKQKRKDTETLKELFGTCRRARTRVKTMLPCQSSGQGTPVSIKEKHLNGDYSVNEKISKPFDYIKEQ